MTAPEIVALLRRHRFPARPETAVQDRIAAIFTTAGVEFVKEDVLTPGERIDFSIGPIGIEVKLRTTADTIRQLIRYAETTRFTDIILVCAWAPPATWEHLPTIAPDVRWHLLNTSLASL